ncbi:hypothetical protein ATKI12_6608 [Kitasatospora sp. Ki12]
MLTLWFHVDASNRASSGPDDRWTAYALNAAFNCCRPSNSPTPRPAAKSVHSRTVRT